MSSATFNEMIKIAICDDENLILVHLKELLSSLLSSIGKVPVIDCFLSGKKFLESSNNYDIVFMDIELKQENGLVILNDYKNHHNAIFIILTSHVEEMAHGYFVRAFRFLVKPIDINLLKEAVFSAIDSIKKSLKFSVTDERGNIIPIKSKDIIYFEAGDRKSGVKTMENFYIIGKTLKEIIPQLDTQFYFVHRSYIINFNFIDRINGSTISMLDGSIITVSRLKKADFNEKFYDFVRRKSWNDCTV
jgi:two-component system response regulator LytT